MADNIARITSPHFLLCTMTHMHLGWKKNEKTNSEGKNEARKKCAAVAAALKFTIYGEMTSGSRTHILCLLHDENLCANVRAFSHIHTLTSH